MQQCDDMRGQKAADDVSLTDVVWCRADMRSVRGRSNSWRLRTPVTASWLALHLTLDSSTTFHLVSASFYSYPREEDVYNRVVLGIYTRSMVQICVRKMQISDHVIPARRQFQSGSPLLLLRGSVDDYWPRLKDDGSRTHGVPHTSLN
jgi:hypothetical protein